jgi:hypothetical protein
MTEPLQLPKQFSGSWENLLILTYGVDVPFFESSIWRELSARCRNKIILADGAHYLEACLSYAQNGLARYLNQKYVVEGIFLPRAAHAKVILLTRPDQGRLFIGSGNLNWPGYASGGELFTQYDYSSEHPELLPAFLAIWNMVEDLISRNSIGPAALPYLHILQEKTPWLFRSVPDSWQPVRSNLKASFLEQLREIINNEPVIDLWVLAPFYDQNAIALKRLLDTFSPQNVHLVVQSEYTSLDPDSVLNVLYSFSGKWEINPFFSLQGDKEKTYVHAKLILIKTQTRSICLQGSPNLSQAALLLTVPQGNFEIANLLVGTPQEFDGLLAALGLETTTNDFSSLNVSYKENEKPQSDQQLDWQLISAEWQHDQLSLYFLGRIPSLSNAKLKIGSDLFDLDIIQQQDLMLVVRISAQAQGLLNSPVPVTIFWEDEKIQPIAAPVFPCNIASLVKELHEERDDDQQLGKLGDFDLGDTELERLLAELDSALPIDRLSIWRLAGKEPPVTSEDNDDALRISYLDIDYEKLRQHPKIIQYYRNRVPGGESIFARSRLQIILSSIIDHFQGITDVAHGKPPIGNTGLGGNSEEGDDNTQDDDGKEIPKKLVNKGFIRKILKGFIRRYLRGLKSRDFIELVGFEVVTNNYVIFSHILWRLLENEWVEQEFILDSFFQVWEFIWGTNKKIGFLYGLDETERLLCLQLIREQHTDAQWIATIFYGEHLCRLKGWNDRRQTLRDFYRNAINRQLFDIDKVVIEEIWVYADSLMPYTRPLPGYIFQNLTHLAKYETQQSFLRSLETSFGLEVDSCEIDNQQSYYQKHLNRSAPGDCLVIKDTGNVLNKEIVILILQYWMKYQRKDYYRIVNNINTIICWYCPSIAEGLYYQSAPCCDEDLLRISPALPNKWETELIWIQDLATQIDNELSISLQSVRQIA